LPKSNEDDPIQEQGKRIHIFIKMFKSLN